MTVVEVIGEWKEGLSWEDQRFDLGSVVPVVAVASADPAQSEAPIAINLVVAPNPG